jgi:hypothetical protein
LLKTKEDTAHQYAALSDIFIEALERRQASIKAHHIEPHIHM